MFEKNKASADYLTVEESNYLCSRCLKKMFRLLIKDTTVNICSKCKRVFVEKEELDKTIQLFLRNGKFL